MATNDVRSFLDDRVPEEMGSTLEPGFARKFILSGRTDKLGDLGVGMQAGEAILTFIGGRFTWFTVTFQVESKKYVETIGSVTLTVSVCLPALP